MICILHKFWHFMKEASKAQLIKIHNGREFEGEGDREMWRWVDDLVRWGDSEI